MKSNYFFLLAITTITVFSCALEPENIPFEDQFRALPESVIWPVDNPYSSEKVELGKKLFWDPVLSGNKDVACVTCHHPSNGYAEQLDLSIGVGGEGLSEARRNGTLVKRNSMTILNSAFNGIQPDGSYAPEKAPMFWDNRNESLEEQAIQPILSAEEMRGTQIAEEAILDTIINRLENIEAYKNLFNVVFGVNSITEENIGKAIAAFERTLISTNSPFDQYSKGDENAMTSQQIRGMINFMEAGCADCHNGPMFSDYELHVLTVDENDKLNEIDEGDGNFAFRTPTLRNLKSTAPYMHNGTLATLRDVMVFYDDVDDESQNPHISSRSRDEDLRNLNLPDDKVNSIIAFLEALNDEDFDKAELETVPSGLSPGGAID